MAVGGGGRWLNAMVTGYGRSRRLRLECALRQSVWLGRLRTIRAANSEISCVRMSDQKGSRRCCRSEGVGRSTWRIVARKVRVDGRKLDGVPETDKVKGGVWVKWEGPGLRREE